MAGNYYESAKYLGLNNSFDIKRRIDYINDSDHYVFTPSQSGNYIFTAGWANSDIINNLNVVLCDIYVDYVGGQSGTNFQFEAYCEAGKTYWVSISSDMSTYTRLMNYSVDISKTS
ncbi:MAG: hypothetical protein E7614_07850 [Ruminococcaceae bacterium]|nr:hypothetical protein [Oscillospiraceae bacterium]